MQAIKFESVHFTTRKNNDIILIPFWEKKKATCASTTKGISDWFNAPISTGDFKGKKDEIITIYLKNQKEKRAMLIGLGKEKELTKELLRIIYGKAATACKSKKLTTINLLLPSTSTLTNEDCTKAICEGLLISNYSFTNNKTKDKKIIKKASLISANKSSMNKIKELVKIIEASYITRDLVNGNADKVTPEYFGKITTEIGKKYGFKTTVFDKKRIEKEKMGLLLAVSQASHREPKFVIAEYKGNPKSKDHTIIIGKGITFDSGGLNLKPSGYIETMRCDMAGAATVLGIITAIAALKLKVNITALMPATENIIGPKSFKPGDVYTSYSGKTVEIGNTDAEGRLILADAISYACKNLKPTRIIDFATLTGAIVVALGNEIAGMMTNDKKLARALKKASQNTYEQLWQLPLPKEYKEYLKSDIADINNVAGAAGKRAGGSITAALFLQEFVDEKIPWAHMDIAGSATFSKPTRYYSKGATGIGVRLFLDFINQLKS